MLEVLIKKAGGYRQFLLYAAMCSTILGHMSDHFCVKEDLVGMTQFTGTAGSILKINSGRLIKIIYLE